MSKDFDPDPTYSTLENPTAAYPRDQLGPFDSEESEPSRSQTPPPAAPVAPGAPRADDGVSMLYLGLALVGGGLLAVGVSGLLAIALFAGS